MTFCLFYCILKFSLIETLLQVWKRAQMKATNVKSGIFSLILFLSAFAPAAMAERIEPEKIAGSSWDYELYVDLWLPWAPVTVTHGDLEVELPETLRTLLRSLNFFSVMRFKASKGPVGFFVNPLYFNGSWEDEFKKPALAGREYKVNERVFLVDFGMSYEIGRWDIGKNGKSRELSLEPYAGFRYLHDNLTLKVGPGRISDGFKKYIQVESTSPIIGLQSRAQVTDSWDVLFVGDYGGFGVNDMDVSFQLATYFEYNFKWGKTKDKSARVSLGYRYLHLDHDSGETRFELAAKGPVLGLGFLF